MPTVALIEVLRSTAGPVKVDCFPYSKPVARQAAAIEAGTEPGRLIFRDAADCSTYRYTPQSLARASWQHRGQ